MANDTFNMLEEDAFAANPPEVAATLADYNDPVVGAQSQPANTTKEERDIADAQVAEETFTDAYMEKADREMRMAADANVARQNQTRREADAKVAGEAIDVVAQAGNQTVADAQAKEREKQRAEAQRLASGVTRHQDETTLLLKANMAKLKAKERADNEAKGYVASGGGIAGETGRRRRRGEAPLRLTPQETFDATNKINSILSNGTVSGAGLTTREVESMRDDLDESLVGRRFLDNYDSKKADFESRLDQTVNDFKTMSDVEKFIDSEIGDPYIADYVRTHVAESITDDMKRTFAKNQSVLDETERKRQESKLHDMETFQETRTLAESDKLGVESRKGEHRSIYFKREDGKWKRRDENETRKMIKDYRNAKALGKDVETLMTETINETAGDAEMVFSTYENETDGKVYEGDGIGFVYDAGEAGPDAVSLTDDEITRAYESVLEALDSQSLGEGKTANITWAIDEYVENVYGENNQGVANEIGRQVIDRLEQTSADRKNSYNSWRNDKISTATKSFKTINSVRGDIKESAAQVQEGGQIIDDNVSYRRNTTESQKLTIMANISDEEINSIVKSEMLNIMVNSGAATTADIELVRNQIELLESGVDPRLLNQDVVETYNMTKEFVTRARNDAAAKESARQIAIEDAKIKEGVARDKKSQQVAEEQERIKKEAEQRGKIVSFDIENPDSIAVTFNDDEVGKQAMNLWENAGNPDQKKLAEQTVPDTEMLRRGEVQIMRTEIIGEGTQNKKTKEVPVTIVPKTEDDWDEYEAWVQEKYADYGPARDTVLREMRTAKEKQQAELIVDYGWSQKEVNTLNNITTSEEMKELREGLKRKRKGAKEDLALEGLEKFTRTKFGKVSGEPKASDETQPPVRMKSIEEQKTEGE